jgi:hypothetical protein
LPAGGMILCQDVAAHRTRSLRASLKLTADEIADLEKPYVPHHV